MSGIGLEQLAVSLVKKKILDEGTSAEALLGKLKEANIFADEVDLTVRVQPSELQKLLIFLRNGPSKKVVRKKLGVSAAEKKETSASSSKIVFRKKSTQSRNVVEIEASPVTPVAQLREASEVEVDVTDDTVHPAEPVSLAEPVEKKTLVSTTKKQSSPTELIQTREDLAHSLKEQLVGTGKTTSHASTSNYAEMKRQKKELKQDRISKKKGKKTKYINVRKGTATTSPSFTAPTEPVIRDVYIPELITVSELAKMMSVKAVDVIKTLMTMGSMVTRNQPVDQDTACLLVEEMGHRAHLKNTITLESQLEQDLESYENREQCGRAPVVTIMGHVDHGKTSLLDYIRRTKTALGEAGGITQHIGAYRVASDKGLITFLDTPGHEAFTAMRARGAKCTDIVVLIVAADDGVMPQTQEAIQHAKAADVPLIVAVNKIDKVDANPQNIRNQLLQHEVVPEELGGQNIFQDISAKTGEGVEELLSSIALLAEMMELKAANTGPMRGVVIESRLEKGRGVVATILVTEGELKKGDIILAGTEFGRVRLMHNDTGDVCDLAGPSTPVEILGLSGVPTAGDDVVSVNNERQAREVSVFRKNKSRDVRLARQHAARLENVMVNMDSGKVKTLNIVLKADVQGSLEAITASVNKLSGEEVKVRFIVSSVGAISQSDINLAMASNAIVVGFNVRAGSLARSIAEKEFIELRYYSIIYNLIDDIKSAITGMLSPIEQEKIVGLARVREVFRSSKLGPVAGCIVVEGVMKRSLPVRVLRDNVVIFQGELDSLRRFKDVVTEVKKDTECGIGVKNYSDIKEGDKIECYEVIKVARTLD